MPVKTGLDEGHVVLVVVEVRKELPVRLQLDNGKIYDILAMLTPKYVGRKDAWLVFRSNLSAWTLGLKIPMETQRTLKGVFSWLLVFGLHSITLIFLPFMWLFGYSLKAYTLFTRADEEKLPEYRRQLEEIYSRLSEIEDREEYLRRLEEEVAKIKPY